MKYKETKDYLLINDKMQNMFENREREANYKFIGIEMTDEYLPICESRIEYALNKYEYDAEIENKKDHQEGRLNIFDFIEEDVE